MIRGINDLFLHEESSIWQEAKENSLETEEEKLYWLGEHFPEIEGKQERVYEAMTVADAVLDETMNARREMITQLGLEEDFVSLQQLVDLSSGSDFVELRKPEEQKVTAQMAEEAAEKLVEELKQAFKGQSRLVRRAVMANTLEKIPVFFSTPQEVADYISQSLVLCDDEAEKYASKQLINDMMG